MVRVKNKITGVVSEFSDDQWKMLKEGGGRWRETFDVIVPSEVPAEVKKLEEKKQVAEQVQVETTVEVLAETKSAEKTKTKSSKKSDNGEKK